MEKKVLIIEFDRREAQTLAATMARNGYRPLIAGTGARGLELFYSEAPDFIFINFLMPDVQGADIIRRIRSREDGAKVPIYVISQIASESETIFKRVGADGKVNKPVDQGLVISLVERYLGPGHAPPAEPESRPAKGAARASSAPENAKDEGIPARGSLRAHHFHQLIAQIFRARESGVLRLKDETGQVVVTFHRGCPTKVETDGLARRLSRDGLISDREAQMIRRRVAEEGVSAQQAATDLKLIDPDRLADAVRGFSYAALRDLCQPRQTRFIWEPGRTEAGPALDPAVVIELAAKRHFPPEKVTVPFETKGRLTRPMYLAADPADLPDLERRPAAKAVVAGARHRETLSSVINRGAAPTDEIMRAAYALALLKVITFEESEAWAGARNGETPVSAVRQRPTAPQPEPSASAVRQRPTAPQQESPASAVRARPMAPPVDPNDPATSLAAAAVTPPPTAATMSTPKPPSAAELTDEQLLRQGRQYLRDKTFSKAQRCLEELVDRGRQDDPRLLTMLASATARNRFSDSTDRLFAAVDWLRRALTIDPRYAEARLELARVFVEAGHADLARAELREQQGITPDNEEVQRELRALERRERRSE